MATRQIIPINKCVKCHVVESGDNAGYCTYEESTAYEAGTVVFYENQLYCAVKDIASTDEDTPLTGSSKWALVLPMVMS